MELPNWDYRWLGLAKHVSSFSKDPSTQVGSVVAIGKDDLAFGYNGFPESCPDHKELYEHRETKYKLVVHAEINAIFKAMKKGRDVTGSTVYTYPLVPCVHCATLLAAAGVVRVVSLVDLAASRSPTMKDPTETELVFDMNGIEYTWIHDHS